MLNFNLPPEIHTWLAHSIPLSIIPGPKAPKDFNSFLHPFVDECKKLATGIWAFNSHENKTFKLHVYLISVHGDMMAIKCHEFQRSKWEISMLHMPYHWSPRHIRLRHHSMSHSHHHMTKALG